MQPEPQTAAPNVERDGAETLICQSCHSQMVRGMRFCRTCGYRLGEGVQEYAETRRFDGFTQPNAHASVTGAPAEWGTMTAPAPGTTLLEQQRGRSSRLRPLWLGCSGASRRMPWVFWLILAIALTSATAGSIFKINRGRNGRGATITRSAPRSYVGVNTFNDFHGEKFDGAGIDYIAPPGSPADKAGLVGGDIVTTFDGTLVAGKKDLMDLLGRTPVGKTVEVEYVRDGQERKTTLTTISEDQMEKLKDAYDDRPEEKGFLGIDIDNWSELESVPAPGTNVKGVRLEKIQKNRNGYIAGLRDGDIVLEFNGIPIRTSEELISRVKRAVPDTTAKFVIVRGTERMEIPVKIGFED